MTIDMAFQHDPIQQDDYERYNIAIEWADDVSHSLEMDAAAPAPQEEKIPPKMFGGTFHDATWEFEELPQRPKVVDELFMAKMREYSALETFFSWMDDQIYEDGLGVLQSNE